MIHYDRWWDPAVESQVTDRAFRIGQTKNVQVHKFIVAEIIEKPIFAAQLLSNEMPEEIESFLLLIPTIDSFKKKFERY